LEYLFTQNIFKENVVNNVAKVNTLFWP